MLTKIFRCEGFALGVNAFLVDRPDPPSAMDTSSAWAMAPSRMAEDRAVLVINPHQHYQGPLQPSCPN